VGTTLAKTAERCGWDLSAPARRASFSELWQWPLDRLALTLAFAAVPISIAASEIFLALGLIARIIYTHRTGQKLRLPWAFRVWLLFAALVLISWVASPDRAAGWSEIRRLFLVASLFYVMPALQAPGARLAAWRGIFLASGLASVFLIGDFIGRLVHYQPELSVGGSVGLYLRTGGLLNHWMVYATVEIIVVAGLIAFWTSYPEYRKRFAPILFLNAAAVALSLTRTAWLVCFVLVVVELVWRRSKWVWLAPALPVFFYLLAPSPVRTRIDESIDPDYYSNQERVQMLRVGWQLIRENPVTGVGAGRIAEFYRGQLRPGEPVPAYFGHLHNNVVQMAATQGVPVALAALLVAASLLVSLLRVQCKAESREIQFASRAGVLALVGFCVAGMFEYTYGHSLPLILLSFAVIAPLVSISTAAEGPHPERSADSV